MRALTPLGLFALALVVRLLPWATVMESGRVVFFGMDAWYHLRRIQLTFASGGWPPAFDPYVNFPHGAQPIWPPLFDALLSWVLWPVYGMAGPGAVERGAALLPPVIGALCVVVLYRLALRLWDPGVALVAGLLLSVLSAHYWYSQIGFVDHHVAVALAATALLVVTVRLLEAPSRGWWVAGGMLVGGCLLLWPGMVLHVGLAELGIWVRCMAREEREAAVADARGLALLNVLAFALVLPFGASASWASWSEFSPTVVSRFQPWLLGVLALHAVACATVWSRSRRGAGEGRGAGESRGAGEGRGEGQGGRVLLVASLAFALLIVSAVALPDLLAGADEARRWLTKDEVFQGLVQESKPLFVAEEGFDTVNAEKRLSRFFYLLPFALAALVRLAWKRPRRPELLFLAFWVLALASVTLLQRRFFNSLSPGFALVLAWAGVSLWRARPEALRGSGLGRTAAVGAAVAVAVAGLAPMVATYRLPLKNLLDAARGTPLMVPRAEFSRRLLMDAAVWMRDNTPPTAGLLDPTAKPEYGVLAPWSYGHLLKYVGQRPTVVGNFGDDVGEANLRRTTAYFASREPDAVRILQDLRARYVMVRTLGDVPPERLLGEAMRKRLSVDDSPGLHHHRLVYESPLGGDALEIGRSEYRVFERVEGARIVGRAPPGAQVHAVLAYESNRGRRGRYVSTAVSDGRGRYEIRVPYASRGGPPGVVPDGGYVISTEFGAADLAVAERAVRTGADVAGPDFAGR